jgi:YD repeat-containing protein
VYLPNGQLSEAVNEGITYTNIVYDSAGQITAYRETSPTGTAQDITVTYNSSGFISTVSVAEV